MNDFSPLRVVRRGRPVDDPNSNLSLAPNQGRFAVNEYEILTRRAVEHGRAVDGRAVPSGCHDVTSCDLSESFAK